MTTRQHFTFGVCLSMLLVFCVGIVAAEQPPAPILSLSLAGSIQNTGKRFQADVKDAQWKPVTDLDVFTDDATVGKGYNLAKNRILQLTDMKLGPLHEYTLSCLFKPTTLDNNTWEIIRLVERKGWKVMGVLKTFGDGKVTVNYQTAADDKHNVMVGTTRMTVNTWYRLALTVKEGDKVRLYVNGALEAEAPVAALPENDGAYNLQIGMNTAYSAVGMMADVRLYDKCLDATQLLREATVTPVTTTPAPPKVDLPKPVTTDLIRQRGIVSLGNTARLAAVFTKAERGEPITVAAIGGSITAGGLQTKDPKNRYIARVADWFTATFPKSKVQFVNAGIGATNSIYGALRLQGDVLDKKPDLVIVEFAVNDPADDRTFAESYEGLLRQLLQAPQGIAVIELFFMHGGGINAQVWQEMLGRHYGLPMVSFRDAWWPELSAKRAAWDAMYADVVHPNDVGHGLATDLLVALLEQERKLPQPIAPAAALPAPLISDRYARCAIAQRGNLKPTTVTGWTKAANGAWESTTPDSVIEFTFSGTTLFLGFDVVAGQTAKLTCAIDDGKSQPLDGTGNRLPVAEGLAAGLHRVRITVAGGQANPTGKVTIWAVGGAGL